jgi:hypothetical protein
MMPFDFSAGGPVSQMLRPGPIFSADWHPLPSKGSSGAVKKALLSLGNFKDGEILEDVFYTSAPFWASTDVWEASVIKNGVYQGTATWLVANDRFVRLKGTSKEIHVWNATTPPQISDSEAAWCYLQLFCNGLDSEHGTFQIVSDPSHLNFNLPTDLPALTFSRLQENWIRPIINYNYEKSTWQILAGVVYAKHYFIASFSIGRSGHVNMDEDSPVLTDLLVRQQLFRNGLRNIDD